MRHQPVVLADVPAEIGEVVGVAVRAVKAEGEDRQADVARIAHAMDDLRAGQHQADQAEIIEIAGHLVDDARLVRRQRVQLARDRLSPPRPASSCGRRGDAPHGLRAFPAAERAEGLPERRPLAGAMRLRMGGQDLLAQRRAGARHADDEDRRRIGDCRARGPSANAPRRSSDVGVDEGEVFVARERLRAAQQRVAGDSIARRRARARPGPTRISRDRNAP